MTLSIAFLILAIFTIQPNKSFAAGEISLTDLKAYSNSSYYYVNQWDYKSPFEDTNGNLIVSGIGLSTYSNSGGTSYGSYNIKNMSYKTFSTTLSLDSKWTTGDYGQSSIGFYADDVLLYEKQLSKNTQPINVNISLPAKVTNFHIIVKQLKGGKGTQRVILSNPIFSMNGTYSNKFELPVSLTSIGANKYSGYYTNAWSYNSVFQDIKGNLLTGGIGLGTNVYGGTSYTSYNIDKMGYDLFEAKVSLDSKWIEGDFGRSAIGIYADDYLLYEKEINSKTSLQSIKLSIPKGTKNLKIVTKQIKGARGSHGIVLINPIVKKTTMKELSIPKTVSFSTVGATNVLNYFYVNEWRDGTPFQYSTGQLVTDGIALASYPNSGGSAYAIYDVKNMGFNSLKTKLSLDSKYLLGDFGKSSVYIYGDNKLLYSSALSKKDLKSLTIRLPKNTNIIKILIQQTNGARGTQGVIFGNAVFTNIPVSSKLSAAQVTISNYKKKDDNITVKTITKNDLIKFYNSKGKVISSGTAKDTSLKLKVKQLGTSKGILYVTRTISGKLESDKIPVKYKAE